MTCLSIRYHIEWKGVKISDVYKQRTGNSIIPVRLFNNPETVC